MESDHSILLRLATVDFDSLEWQHFRDGISIFPLYQSKTSMANAALLKYVAGASVPVHVHTGYEHIFVLEGSQEDQRGVYRKGDFFISKPGTKHAVKSSEGCVVLAIWEKPVQFI